MTYTPVDPIVTARLSAHEDAHTLTRAVTTGAYGALRTALGQSPEDVQEAVKVAVLQGRGGAGFPAGAKWGLLPQGKYPRWLVVNGDESEPGTYKDRMLMERDPHQLIEGALICAYAIRASGVFLYVRGEMALAQERIAQALNEAYAAGYVGRNILGSAWSMDITMHWGAGAYIVGDETALLESLSGRRGMPRPKPPYFPAAIGLYDQPTIVNNVETLSNVPHIVNHGAEWFKGLSQSKDGGTKLYGASGRVKRPGLWELPIGTPIREILDEHAGGMRDGVRFRGLLPGGASTDFLTEEHLDVKMDFDSVQAAGSRLGTGTMIVLDDQTCPVGMVKNLEHFFAQESCGWCTPCWGGLQSAEQMLQAIEDGKGRPEDLERLAQLTRLLRPGHTFCALAPGAMEPLQSALKYFKADFERHISERRCPWS
jgi:NADH-quinone oxidoreductase subunit F